MVDLETIYSDSADRTGRTEILAGAAAYALALVHGRDADRFGIVRIFLYHLDSSGRAVTGAVAALLDSAVIDKAEPWGDFRGTDFPLGLLLWGDLQDRSRRAHLRAFDTFGAAIASLE